MATLNQLASKIANHLNKPFDHELKERIKDSYRFYRAERIRQSIEKSGIDDTLKVSYAVDLELVDIADDCVLTVGCSMLKSVNKVVKPIRYKTDEPFTFVGTLDGIPFIYSDISSINYMKYLPNIGKAIYYYYENDYIIVKGNTKIERIRIQCVPSNIETMIDLCNSTNGCWDDDMEYPLPDDLIESITTEILRKYSAIYIKDKEIPINEESTTTT